MDVNKAFEINKDTWNKKVAIHAASDFYDLENFKKGVSSLNKYELEALGDVREKSLLHLQCHFGQDTLSWSRMGARCTGVDISTESIKLARELTTELDLDARFVCCNVLDTSKHVSEKFDIAITSYGTIGWLPELKGWAQMIAERLNDNGVFYMVEFHPIVWMFDYTQKSPQMVYGYHQKDVIYEEYTGTYADPSSNMISKEYGWNHGLGDVITALAEAGLQIEYLNELDESPYNVFPGLIENEEGMFELPGKMYPLLFELSARKI